MSVIQKENHDRFLQTEMIYFLNITDYGSYLRFTSYCITLYNYKMN